MYMVSILKLLNEMQTLNEGEDTAPSTILQAQQLNVLFQHPIKAKDGFILLSDIIFGDYLSDEFGSMEPNEDVRPVVADFLQTWFLTHTKLPSMWKGDDFFNAKSRWEPEALELVRKTIKPFIKE